MTGTEDIMNVLSRTTPRKVHIKLNEKTLAVCLKMWEEGSSINQISEYSGQGIRAVQNRIKKVYSNGTSGSGVNFHIHQPGPKPSDEENLKVELEAILQTDNSLTIEGNPPC